MMHEKKRFAIALSGVGACLSIAAGIMLTAPREIATPPAPSIPVVCADGLAVPAPPVRFDAGTVARAEPITRVAAPHLRSSPRAGRGAARPGVLPASTPAVVAHVEPRATSSAPELSARPLAAAAVVPLALSDAPRAMGTDIVVAEQRSHERGIVTGAFVAAGTHVGGSFKTVGRTLRRVF